MLTLDFAGEAFTLDPAEVFVIGREGDLAIDDNPYLHRSFLTLEHVDGLWWLSNVGNRVAATIADPTGQMQAYLSAGGRLPIVFPVTMIWFTAGVTTYELRLDLEQASYVGGQLTQVPGGEVTWGDVSFTESQKQLILALAEPILRQGGRGASSIPTSAEAAARLGWSATTFNRKLDNVCDKLTRSGVRGLHGSSNRLAVNRRARLVEYAVAARIVTADDLPLLSRS